MRTTTSGLLLLLIGVAGLAGFLTGNLDRWLGYLFDPMRPALVGLGGASSGPGYVATGAARSSIGNTGAGDIGGLTGDRRI